MRHYGDKPLFTAGDIVERNPRYGSRNWEYATVIECLPVNCHVFHEKGWGYYVLPFDGYDEYRTERLWYHEPFLQVAHNPPID